jgi:hypothetical protein
MAASAESSARLSPEASPVPIIALPISRMTARTSAKSRLMRPSFTIRSVDAGDAGIEHLVGHGEGGGQGGPLVGDAEQVLVRDDDQRVDALLQLHNPRFGEPHPALPFEVERLGNNADRQDAEFTCGARNHRGGAGSGAAAHAGGDEHHVSAGQVIADLVDHLLGGGAADVRLRTGAETSGRRHAHLDDVFGPRHGQRLGIRVGDDEVDALQPGADHVIDSVTARAADADADAENGNPRLQFADVQSLRVNAQRPTSLVRGRVDRRVSPVGAAALTAARPLTGKGRSGSPGPAASAFSLSSRRSGIPEVQIRTRS